MKEKSNVSVEILIGFLLLTLVGIAIAEPSGPTITHVTNSTKAAENGTLGNATVGGISTTPNKAGAYIFESNLDSQSQNSRWKAYVGNVTGSLTLDDASGYTVYNWPLTTSISGEVYATRTSGSINWTNINCSYGNSTLWEERMLNHTTNPNDNISTTFNQTDNSEFYVGDVRINASLCPTINLYINGTQQADVDQFEQILLYDGTRNLNISESTDFKNVVYASIMEEDAYGYNNNGSTATQNTYDFQMILPEVGLDTWTSSTPYYFYVELS